jgi:hypothetical protein
MHVVEIPRETDKFILHFETPRHEVNAFALATSLVGLANAVKEANSIVNPGHSIEVVVERLEDGSFRALIKTITKQARNIFASEASKAILYGLISTWIYEHAFHDDKPPIVIVNEGSVEVRTGDTRVIVPRETYEAKKAVERSEHFQRSMSQIFAGALLDRDVTGLKLTPPGKWPSLPVVPRESFAKLIVRLDIDEANAVVEDAHLEISRAILARGRRKWEFYWRGMKISAPVLDESFYDKFFAHEITIAPGDVLNVLLKIYRKTDTDSGITMNSRYEVVEVLDHEPRGTQASF